MDIRTKTQYRQAEVDDPLPTTLHKDLTVWVVDMEFREACLLHV